MNTPQKHDVTVSVIIKTLNEENKVTVAIESALEAVAEIGGEVILADSGSTDRTIEIAQQYPIGIIQLSNKDEKCCGIGPQLGYQIAKGEFVYILDGDMKMLPNFLPQAVDLMKNSPELGGIGGQVIEMNKESLEFQARVERASEHMQAGLVDRLDMGGLYRRTAIDEAGYFSNRNLHSYEELDLAIRMRSKGWKLQRINVDAVKHWGHDTPPYQLLIRRWKSGYINGLGEIVRASWGQPQWQFLIKDVRELKLYTVVILWWLTLLSSGIMSLQTDTNMFLWILLLPFVLMTFKKKSLNKAIYSVISWNLNSAGLIRGIFSKPTPPLQPIDFCDIKAKRD